MPKAMSVQEIVPIRAVAGRKQKPRPGGTTRVPGRHMRGSVGHFDGVRCGGLVGWVADLDQPNVPLHVSIEIAGRIVGETLANKYRGDLVSAGFVTGLHG